MGQGHTKSVETQIKPDIRQHVIMVIKQSLY